MVLGVSLLVVLAVPGQGAGTEIYMRGRGRGVLELRSAEGTAPQFSLLSLGSNFGTCQIEGRVEADTLTTSVAQGGGAPCVLGIRTDAATAEITSFSEGSDGCAAFCGAGASPEGVYQRIPLRCAPRTVQAARDASQLASERGRYRTAARALEPVLACDFAIEPLEEASIRNDLASAYQHLRRDQACREVLAPLEWLVEATERQLTTDGLPAETKAWLLLQQSIRTNLRRCRSGP